jgi:hypothetical protein
MLKFFSLIPSLVYDMPIEKAKISDFKWYKSMVCDYQSFVDKPVTHTAKCPGILSVCGYGWIQRAYQDLKIITNGDGETFTCKYDIEQAYLQYGDIMNGYVHYHDYPQLFKYNEFKKDTLKTIIKIQSPWAVDIPEGFLLLSMPIPYNDENNFTAAHGFITGLNFMNVQLFWHSLTGEVLIKKGTPLCQYILIRKEEVEFSVNSADDYLYQKLLTKK